MERPLLVPLSAVIAGLSIAGTYRFFIPECVLAPLLTVVFLAFFLKGHRIFVGAGALLIAVCANMSLSPFLRPHFPADHVDFITEAPQNIEGIIDSRPEATEFGRRFYLRAEKVYRMEEYAPVSGRIPIYVGEGRVRFRTGDRVRFVARLSRPRNYGLPVNSISLGIWPFGMCL